MENFFKNSAWFKEQDPDIVNAPFPDELKKNRKNVAEEIIEKHKASFNVKDKSESSRAFVKEMLDRVFDTANVDKKGMQPHFQAVNLEHYAEKQGVPPKRGEEDERHGEDNPDLQRVEVRRITAPGDRQELLMQLNKIFELIAAPTRD